MHKNYKYLGAISVFFVSVLLISNVASTKIVDLKWFVFETSRYKTLDHNNLPVSSPYWTIINKLGQFLSDNCECELKQIIQNKDNIDNEQFLKSNSGLSFNILYA